MRAKKRLGQNFLQDTGVIKTILDSLELAGNETVIEIGPGMGALTEGLLERSRRVVAVEFDRDMVDLLRSRFASHTTLDILNEDILKADLSAIVRKYSPAGPIKLAANLPYNISTPILQRLIDERQHFSSMVLMFQREVVARISAPPGTKDRGFLSVLAENVFDIERIIDVAPNAFRPVPKVWSTVVKLTPRTPTVPNGTILRKMASAAFAQKRKTLQNNLNHVVSNAAALLERAGIDARRRAETLTIDEWGRLVSESEKEI